jgi:hypothetical protein
LVVVTLVLVVVTLAHATYQKTYRQSPRSM